MIGHVPLWRWKTITFVAALRQNKIAVPMVVEGAMNGGAAISSSWTTFKPTPGNRCNRKPSEQSERVAAEASV